MATKNFATKILARHTNEDTGSFHYNSTLPSSIHILLLEAQNLFSSDSSKMSSPFFIFKHELSDEKADKSPIYPKTLDPVTNFQTTLNFKDSKLTGNLVIKVCDSAKGFFRDNFLGKVIIPLDDLKHNGVITGWFALVGRSNDAKSGKFTTTLNDHPRVQGRLYVRIIADQSSKNLQKTDSIAFALRRSQLLDIVRLLEAEYDESLRFAVSKYLCELDAKQRKKEREQKRLARLKQQSLVVDRPYSMQLSVNPSFTLTTGLSSQQQQGMESRHMTFADKNELTACLEEEAALFSPNRDVSAKFSFITALRQPLGQSVTSPNPTRSGGLFQSSNAWQSTSPGNLTPKEDTRNNSTNPNHNPDIPLSNTLIPIPTPSLNLPPVPTLSLPPIPTLNLPPSPTNSNLGTVRSNGSSNRSGRLSLNANPHALTSDDCDGQLIIGQNGEGLTSFFSNSTRSQGTIGSGRTQPNSPTARINNNTSFDDFTPPITTRAQNIFVNLDTDAPNPLQPPPPRLITSITPIHSTSNTSLQSSYLLPEIILPTPTNTTSITPTNTNFLYSSPTTAKPSQTDTNPYTNKDLSPDALHTNHSATHSASHTLATPTIPGSTLFSMSEGCDVNDSDDCEGEITLRTINQPHVILERCEGRKNIIYSPHETDLPLLPSPQPPPYISTSPCFICSSLQHPEFKTVPIEFVSTQPLADLPKRHEAIFDPNAITQDDVIHPAVAYKLQLCCATFNVGNTPPSSNQLLKDWLRGDCDVYVIGTQENAYTPRKPYKTHLEDFNATVLGTLGQQYELLHSEDLGQIHIHLVVRSTVKPYVDLLQPQRATVSTGLLGGAIPNKGGACIALTVFGNTFCFLNSHLAAHTQMKSRRDHDMRSIVRGVNFHGAYAQTSLMNAFHHVFWLGDLNYRCTFAGSSQKPDPLKFELMLDKIRCQTYDELLLTDQLLFETLENKTAFVGFNDSPIEFAPSFKVKKGEYQAYDPRRTPSYCDRILWKSQPGFEKQIQFLSFDSAQSVISSDHKPVSAIFNIFPSMLVSGVSPRLENVTFTLTSMSLFHITTAKGSDTDPNDPPIMPYMRISSTLLSSTLQTTTKKGIQTSQSSSSIPTGDGNSQTNNSTNLDKSTTLSSHIPSMDPLNPLAQATPAATWLQSELPPLIFTASSEGRLWESSIVFGVFDHNHHNSLLSNATLSFKTEDIVSFLHDNASSRQPHPALQVGPRIPSERYLMDGPGANSLVPRVGGLKSGSDSNPHDNEHYGDTTDYLEGNLTRSFGKETLIHSPSLAPHALLAQQTSTSPNSSNPNSHLQASMTFGGSNSSSPQISHFSPKSQPSAKVSKAVSVSAMPSAPTMRIAADGDGLELELDRFLQLYTPNGQEGGVLRITGLITFDKKQRPLEYGNDESDE